MSKIRPLVFSGPSGAGKSTLLKMLMQKHPECFGFSVSHTTRDPRPGEKDGVDYHFSKRETMHADIKEGRFIEHAEFAGNLYGTSRSAVTKVLDTGRICILDVDLAGVKSIYEFKPSLNAQFIFIRPPSLDCLEKRLRDRNTETEEKIKARLSRAGADMEFADSALGRQIYNLQIVNDDLDVAYAQMEGFLIADIQNLKNTTHAK